MDKDFISSSRTSADVSQDFKAEKVKLITGKQKRKIIVAFAALIIFVFSALNTVYTPTTHIIEFALTFVGTFTISTAFTIMAVGLTWIFYDIVRTWINNG